MCGVQFTRHAHFVNANAQMQQSGGCNVLQMCKIRGEIKAETLVAGVTPATIWSRYPVWAVRVARY